MEDLPSTDAHAAFSCKTWDDHGLHLRTSAVLARALGEAVPDPQVAVIVESEFGRRGNGKSINQLLLLGIVGNFIVHLEGDAHAVEAARASVQRLLSGMELLASGTPPADAAQSAME